MAPPMIEQSELFGLMETPSRVRHVAVVAHVDHGKATLRDVLVGAGKTIKTPYYERRYTGHRLDEPEQERLPRSALSIAHETSARPRTYRFDNSTSPSDETKAEGETSAEESHPQCDHEGPFSRSEPRRGPGTPPDPERFLVNLVDVPRPGDATADLKASLRIADGCLVVIDCVEGFVVNTETVLRAPLLQRVRPVVMLNKIDRIILELQISPEEMYQGLLRTLENVDGHVSSHFDGTWPGTSDYIEVPPPTAGTSAESGPIPACTKPPLKKGSKHSICPVEGAVAFGSASQRWGFTIDRFASLYAVKFGIDKQKLARRLWGDHFFDPKRRRWFKTSLGVRAEGCTADDNATKATLDEEQDAPTRTGAQVEEPLLSRAFCKFCLEPLYQLCNAIMASDTTKLDRMLRVLNIPLTSEQRQQKPRQLFITVMQNFLPLGPTVLDMVVQHLPSPAEAQRYRTEVLYTNAVERDRFNAAMEQCDRAGPLMIYVSKMAPAPGDRRGRFYAVGRVFSGTVRAGLKCRIMGANYVPGRNEDDVYSRAVQRVIGFTGTKIDVVDDIGAGGLCVLVGIDPYLVHTGTLTDVDATAAYPVRTKRYSTSPIVRVSVETSSPHDLPRLVEQLKALPRASPSVHCSISESGQHFIAAGCYEELEGAIHALHCTMQALGAPLKMSDPIVALRETVTARNITAQCTSQSPNRHNRLTCVASPLGSDCCSLLERLSRADHGARVQALVKVPGWESTPASRLWAFGPETHQGFNNVVVDSTQGPCGGELGEIKDSVKAAWTWATNEGPLCGEPMRGVRVNLRNAVLHSAAIHRGGGQIIPTMKRLAFAALLTAKPQVMEPIFSFEIHGPTDAADPVSAVVNERGGKIVSSEICGRCGPGSDRVIIKGEIAVAKAQGFGPEVRIRTFGTATVEELLFDHWQCMEGDPTDETTPAGTCVKRRRILQGLDPCVPDAASLAVDVTAVVRCEQNEPDSPEQLDEAAPMRSAPPKK